MNINNLDFIYGLDLTKMIGGTLIAIAQEAQTDKIITAGLMTTAGLEINIRSQKHQSFWSAKTMLDQTIVTRNIFVDCDRDTLLFEVQGRRPLISKFQEVDSLMVIPTVCDQTCSQLLTVVQDNKTKKVLMAGVMNKEAAAKTTETRLITFWSRTRNCLWTKGETSGNFLHLHKIYRDLASNAVVLMVNPIGPVCHTGAETCFQELDCSMRIYRKEERK